MTKGNLKGGGIMSKTNTDIVYMDHRTSALQCINVDGTCKPDSLINIIKNRNIIYHEISLQGSTLAKQR